MAWLPGAVLRVPIQRVLWPMVLSTIAYVVVLSTRFPTLPAVQTAVSCVSCLLLLGLAVLMLRRQELQERHAFLVHLEEPSAEEPPSFNDTSAGAAERIEAPPCAIAPRTESAVVPVGAVRSVAVSSNIEMALEQLRAIQSQTSRHGGRTAQRKQIDHTVRLLESSAREAHVGSSTFDWQKEISMAGVKDSVGAWLISTLAEGDTTTGAAHDPRQRMREESFTSSRSGRFSKLRRNSTSLRRWSFTADPNMPDSSPSSNPMASPSPGGTPNPRHRDNRNGSPLSQRESFREGSSFRRRRSRDSKEEDEERSSREEEVFESSTSPSPERVNVQREIREVAAVVEPLVRDALDGWGGDVLKIEEASKGHALYFVAMAIFTEHNLIELCDIELSALQDFLLRLEHNYGANEYHNSMHGCDVMLHVHVFLMTYRLHKRLTKVQLLAALLGALIHDFNHPGTSNAFEVKVSTVLALTYSDQSVLEFHHLASSFALLRVKGYDILSGLSAEEYRAVRALIVELVLHTDLTKHFDVVGKLKTLASTRGATAYAAVTTATASEGRGHSTAPAASVLASKALCSSPKRRRLSLGSHPLTDAVLGAAYPAGGGSAGRLAPLEVAMKPMEGGRLEPLSKRAVPTEKGSKERNREGCARRHSCGSTMIHPRGSVLSMATDTQNGNHDNDDSFGATSSVDSKAGDGDTSDRPTWTSPFLDEKVDVKLLLVCAIKFADLNHSSKPFDLHEKWTERITREFWALGDREKAMGVPVSPLCDRDKDVNIASTQIGFFQFICRPFMEVLADLVDPELEPMKELIINQSCWEREQAKAAGMEQEAQDYGHSRDPP